MSSSMLRAMTRAAAGSRGGGAGTAAREAGTTLRLAAFPADLRTLLDRTATMPRDYGVGAEFQPEDNPVVYIVNNLEGATLLPKRGAINRTQSRSGRKRHDEQARRLCQNRCCNATTVEAAEPARLPDQERRSIGGGCLWRGA